MVRLALLLFLLALVLAIIALISCISAERGRVRGLPRWAWILVILLLPLAGPTLYLVGGRPERSRPAASVWRQVTGAAEPQRPRRAAAPDDDPEFLRKLDQKGRNGDEDLLRRWEEDLRRREKDPRKQEDTPPTDS